MDVNSRPSEIDLLIQLKTQLVNFLDELIESFPDEPNFVIFRIFVQDQIPVKTLFEYLVEKLLPLQDLVKNKDEKFFLNHNILFENLGPKGTSRVNYFKNMWGNLDQDDKDTIWKWFSSFLYLGNKYKELKELESKK